MTYEKWMEEIVSGMSKETFLPTNKESLNGIDKRYDFICGFADDDERLEE